MSTFSELKLKMYRGLDEDVNNAAVVLRLNDWINDVVQDICQEAGIRGLSAEGQGEWHKGTLQGTLEITSAHNANSRLVNVTMMKYVVYDYDVATNTYVSSDQQGEIAEITFAEYQRRMIESSEAGVPTYFAIGGISNSGHPNCYLYPPPDSSDDIPPAAGMIWHMIQYVGEARIGELIDDDDIVYPLGCDHVIKAGVQWQQAIYDRDAYMQQQAYMHFDRMKKKFVAREHVHKAVYIFGRTSQGTGRSIVWPDTITP